MLKNEHKKWALHSRLGIESEYIPRQLSVLSLTDARGTSDLLAPRTLPLRIEYSSHLS